MLNKFLLIGLGGSGEKLARYLVQDLEERLRGAGWRGSMPLGWRFLCFDIANRSDVLTRDVPASLGPTGKRVPLSDPNLDFGHYRYLATNDPRRLPGLAGAVPAEHVDLPSPRRGAGQRIQVGNLVALAGLDRIRSEIEHQLVTLNGPEVENQMAEVSRAFGPAQPGGGAGTAVMVASSLGGGSGAGMLQLVVETVLNLPDLREHRENVTTLLFTPDIFIDLSERERAGIQANCLYSLSALLNGYEGAGHRSSILADLVAGAGIGIDAGRRAAMTNFFVGRSNGKGVEFNSQDAVIKSTAKAIGRMTVDEGMVTGLAAHLQANREGAAVTSEYRLVSPVATSRPSSSLGYASISLGESQLAAYGSERLARAQLETLLRGRRSLRPSGERDGAVAERIAEAELPRFLQEAGLDEEQALGAVYDREELKREVHEYVERVQGEMRDGTRKAEGAVWSREIDKRFTAYQDRLERERSETREAKVTAWCGAVQARLAEATAASLGGFGGPVTEELLSRTTVHLEELASELDRRRREDRGTKSSGYAQRGRELLDKVKSKRLHGNDKLIEQSSERRGQSAFLREDVANLELTAELLRGVPAGVIAPLRSAVRSAVDRISAEEVKRHRDLVEGWSDEEVSQRLTPAPNQLLLEPMAKMPGLYSRLIESTVGQPVNNAEEQAVQEILTGSWTIPNEDVHSGESRHLIQITAAWRLGSPAPARFEMGIDVPELRDRAEDWLRERSGAFNERLRMPIAKWIGEHPERQEVFAGVLEQALRLAHPLVHINPTAHLRVHGANVDPPKLHVSTLPVPNADQVRSRIEQALRSAGLPAAEVGALIDGTSSARVVEISSFLSQPIEPVTISGIFRPIEGDWRSRTNPALREQFSAFRRTRPMRLFAPISPRAQKQFVRGWIVATMLNQLTEFTGSWERSPTEAWSPQQGWLRFPPNLLGGTDVTEKAEVLGRVLESLPLAIASFSCDQPEGLQAYMRVYDLGEMNDLRRAVAIGVPKRPDGDGDGAANGHARRPPSEDQQTRRQRMLERLDAMRRETESHRLKTKPDAATISAVTPRWEVDDLVLGAIDQIREYLEDLSLPTHPDGEIDEADPVPQ